ncbi:molybdopterin oxidoreductase family protein [Lichenicoccus sp.]|uniref:molybdopterin oxidoreductase family protein n=1 Tax=Lichenicoccus sp. TaxID=2781899 RepID=UPI003D0C185D
MILPRTDTHCPYCALQCGMTLERAASGAWSVQARDFPTNKGGLCRKGWTAAHLLTHPDRLTTPLARARKDAPLRPVSWDTAIECIAERISSIQAQHGKNAIAVFGGGGLTNEKAYLLGKFARVVLGTANIDYNGRFCMSAAAVAGVRAFGIDRGLPFPLEDLPGAEAILITGGNPAETMPPLMQYFDAQRARGGKLIVSDPRRTATARFADLHLQLTPGTDATLARGLLHVAIRDRLIDHAFIAQRTTGWEAVRRGAAAYWPDRVERETGVPASQIVQAAHMLGEAATAIILSGRGTEQQSQGVQNALAFINLALALGHAGRKHCGWGCLTGQGNGQGGREHGLKSDQLPGYRRLDNTQHRAEIARIWDIDPDTLPPPGLHATAMIEALAEPGGIQALLLMGSNLLVSAPASRGLAERLDRLALFVACDHFLSESSKRADIVLPVTQWAEESGTMTNLEGRVIRRVQAAIPPEGVRSDIDILAGLAKRLGGARHIPANPEAAYDELRRASAGGIADYGGITLERIAAEDGVFWPSRDADAPDARRMFLSRFGHDDGRARFCAAKAGAASEMTDRQFPLYLSTGRVLAQYQTGAQTRHVPELAHAEPSVFVEIHPDTASLSGIIEGASALLTTERGSGVFRARLTRDIRRDTLFVPFHWGGEASVNRLTSDAIDPISKIPQYKLCAVRLEAAPLQRTTA